MLPHECRGETLQLLADRALYWPRERMLVVADVHFGKAATFRRGGIPIPRGTTQKNLTRLSTLLDDCAAEQLLVLGDLMHARAGYTETLVREVAAWRRTRRTLHCVVVTGNHDRRAGEFPKSWKLDIVAERHDVGPFAFQHHPVDQPTEGDSQYVIAGHVHPCVVLTDATGVQLRTACFYFGSQGAILPAFGAFTGMHPVQPRSGDAIFAVGDDVQRVTLAGPKLRDR